MDISCIDCSTIVTCPPIKGQMKRCRDCQNTATRVNNAAARRKWREAHPDQEKASNKAWRESNREIVKQRVLDWQKANPDRARVKNQKRRALLKGVTSTLTQAEWADIWNQFKGLCFYCGVAATDMEHIVPLQPRVGELQGHHTKENVVPSCEPCNSHKHNMDPLLFLFLIKEKRA